MALGEGVAPSEPVARAGESEGDTVPHALPLKSPVAEGEPLGEGVCAPAEGVARGEADAVGEAVGEDEDGGVPVGGAEVEGEGESEGSGVALAGALPVPPPARVPLPVGEPLARVVAEALPDTVGVRAREGEVEGLPVGDREGSAGVRDDRGEGVGVPLRRGVPEALRESDGELVVEGGGVPLALRRALTVARGDAEALPLREGVPVAQRETEAQKEGEGEALTRAVAEEEPDEEGVGAPPLPEVEGEGDPEAQGEGDCEPLPQGVKEADALGEGVNAPEGDPESLEVTVAGGVREGEA